MKNFEHWTQVECHRFSLIKSLFRSQGLTTDCKGNFWFSSKVSLLKTHSKLASADIFHFLPIPRFLSKLGNDHIGDIDYANGKIYAPIEDGRTDYKHPYIGIYDAETLRFEKSFQLSTDQQMDGVPWVAVDIDNQKIYSSRYHGATHINVYDFNTVSYIRSIEMKEKIDSLQGAKVHNGFLYITADAPAPETDRYAIYRLNLITGDVIQVGEFGTEVSEIEGLTFVPNENGDQLYVIGVVGKGLSRRTALYIFSKDE